MKVLLSMVVVFIVVISPAQNLLASGNHSLIQSKVVQQAASLYSPTDKVDVHCNEHNGKQVECDSAQCVSALSVIVQTADKLVPHNTAPFFLLHYDSAFLNDHLSSLFRPPKG